MIDLAYWNTYIAALDYNPLFVTVSGAHLYGFESPDSDVDLRGCHLLPLRDVVGLALPNERFEKDGMIMPPIRSSWVGTDNCRSQASSPSTGSTCRRRRSV